MGRFATSVGPLDLRYKRNVNEETLATDSLDEVLLAVPAPLWPGLSARPPAAASQKVDRVVWPDLFLVELGGLSGLVT